MKNKKILILGGARSGIAVAKIVAPQNDVTLTDLKPLNKEDENALNALGVKILITDKQEALINKNLDLVIKNPGIMPNSEVMKKCYELKVEVANEMEVGYHYLPKNTFIIGVTGSNGKTTTVTIIYELLKRMKKDVVLCGNIGEPLCNVIDKIKKETILLMEISDHQLNDFKDFKTNISILTNIYPTHLDYHGSFLKYKNTKKKIFNHLDQNDLAIINYTNKDSLDLIKDLKSRIIYFNNNLNYYNEDGLYLQNELFIKKDDILLVGNHNYENILASLIVLKEIGLDKEVAVKFLKEFKGVEHRIEFVAKINDVLYYNDSKATNPTSTIMALKCFNKPIHLILGGLERGQDFNELNDNLANIKAIYAIGEVTDKIKEYANKIKIPVYECYTLKKAMDIIKKKVESGDVVLLSPASASQDQYLKFEDRGNEFKEMVNYGRV